MHILCFCRRMCQKMCLAEHACLKYLHHACGHAHAHDHSMHAIAPAGFIDSSRRTRRRVRFLLQSFENFSTPRMEVGASANISNPGYVCHVNVRACQHALQVTKSENFSCSTGTSARSRCISAKRKRQRRNRTSEAAGTARCRF